MRLKQSIILFAVLVLAVDGIALRGSRVQKDKAAEKPKKEPEEELAEAAGTIFTLPAKDAQPVQTGNPLLGNPYAPLSPLNPFVVSDQRPELVAAYNARMSARNTGIYPQYPMLFNPYLINSPVAPSTNSNKTTQGLAGATAPSTSATAASLQQYYAQMAMLSGGMGMGLGMGAGMLGMGAPAAALATGLMGATAPLPYNPNQPTWVTPYMIQEPNLNKLLSNVKLHNSTEMLTMANGIGQKTDVWKTLMQNNALEGLSYPMGSNSLFYQVPRASDKTFIPFAAPINAPTLPVTFTPVSPFQYEPLPPISARVPLGKQSGWFYDPRRAPITTTIPSPSVVSLLTASGAPAPLTKSSQAAKSS